MALQGVSGFLYLACEQWGMGPEKGTDTFIRFPVSFPSKCIYVQPFYQYTGTAVAGVHTYVTDRLQGGFRIKAKHPEVQLTFIAFGI